MGFIVRVYNRANIVQFHQCPQRKQEKEKQSAEIILRVIQLKLQNKICTSPMESFRSSYCAVGRSGISLMMFSIQDVVTTELSESDAGVPCCRNLSHQCISHPTVILCY